MGAKVLQCTRNKVRVLHAQLRMIEQHLDS